jgi:hypothetical protein
MVTGFAGFVVVELLELAPCRPCVRGVVVVTEALGL